MHRAFFLAVFTILLVGNALGCVCVAASEETPEAYVKRVTGEAHAVFVGKVVGFEYRKGIPYGYARSEARELTGEHETLVVILAVERYWKGGLGAKVLLATDLTRSSDGTSTSSSCNYAFKEGETYLVYAGSRDGFLRTHSCSGTRTLKGAESHLKILGDAHVLEKAQPRKPS